MHTPHHTRARTDACMRCLLHRVLCLIVFCADLTGRHSLVWPCTLSFRAAHTQHTQHETCVCCTDQPGCARACALAQRTPALPPRWAPCASLAQPRRGCSCAHRVLLHHRAQQENPVARVCAEQQHRTRAGAEHGHRQHPPRAAHAPCTRGALPGHTHAPHSGHPARCTRALSGAQHGAAHVVSLRHILHAAHLPHQRHRGHPRCCCRPFLSSAPPHSHTQRCKDWQKRCSQHRDRHFLSFLYSILFLFSFFLCICISRVCRWRVFWIWSLSFYSCCLLFWRIPLLARSFCLYLLSEKEFRVLQMFVSIYYLDISLSSFNFYLEYSLRWDRFPSISELSTKEMLFSLVLLFVDMRFFFTFFNLFLYSFYIHFPCSHYSWESLSFSLYEARVGAQNYFCDIIYWVWQTFY